MDSYKSEGFEKMSFKISVAGMDELETELRRLNSFRLDAVLLKQATQIYNRARKNADNTYGGTPVDTEELRKDVSLSSSQSGGYIVGYTKEYAPHVEYGHRTKDDGYVEGQRFLQKNVEKQRDIYMQDLRREIRKGSGK